MLTLNYVGGGSFSNDGSVSNGIIQGLNFSERLSYRRLCAFILRTIFVRASDTIWGGRNSKRSDFAWWWNVRVRQWLRAGTVNSDCTRAADYNFSGGEMDVLLTPRTSLTFVGGYSLLDSLDDPEANYGDVIFSAGYNYQLSRQNTVGLSYQFSFINYSNYRSIDKE